MLKAAWANNYTHPLPEGHRFPMEKYTLLPEQLLYEGTLTTGNFFEPTMCADDVIVRTHDKNYWQRLKNLELTAREQRKTGFPHTTELITREQTLVQGTIDATHFALKHGIAMNIAGGTHHAFSNAGEGFCLLNDQAVAASELLHHKHASKILIVDLDVHQGNGTAEIFEQNPSVFTFSMHGASNYPMHKMTSDLDVPLPDKIADDAYLNLLDYHLKQLIYDVQPDFMFYQCGVDVLASDKLGKLALSIDGCKERDRTVLQAAKSNHIPLVCSMGGGYSENINTIVTAHANTYRLAQEIFF